MNARTIVAHEVARIRRDDRLLTVLGVMGWLAGGIGCGALLLAEGRWISLPSSTPLVCWVGLVAGAAMILWHAHRWSARRTDPLVVGAGIEGEQGLRRGALVGVLELDGTRDPLVDAAATQLGARLAIVGARPMPRASARRRRALGLTSGATVLGLTLLGGVGTRRPDGWLAMRRPIAAARGTLLPALTFEALPLGVARGTALSVGVRADARRVVSVRWRSVGSGWRDTAITIGTTGRGRLMVARVDADLELIATDGRVSSDTARVRALDRPFLGEVRLFATYPAYLGRPAETLDPELPVVLPEGTVLSLEGRASEPLASVGLAMADPATRFALTVDGTRFRGRFTPARSGILMWVAEGRSTTIADLPVPLAIELVPDAAPRVSIMSPVGSVRADVAERIPLEIVAEDDHGLGAIALRLEVIDPAGRSAPPVERLLASGSDGAWVGGVRLDLAALAMTPGTRLRIVAVAREVGPRARVAESPPLEIVVPTADERREAARALGDSTAGAATATARAQAALAERTAMAARAGDRATVSAEGTERARAIAAQQREVQAQASSLEAAAQAMEERLRQAGVLDTALARQLQDAQRLLREALAGGVDGAVQQLDGARESMDADRTRRSLAELAAQQQRMREALERTSRLLQRAALEGAMRTTADQAAALAQDQRRFADSARAERSPGAESERLARRSAALAQATETMAQRLAAARALTGARGAREAADAARRAEAAQREGAAETAAAAAQGAAETLEATARAQQAEWRGAVTDALDRSVQELLQLAREQEALAQAATEASADPSVRGRQSAVQQGAQAAQRRVAEQAQQSALVSPRSQQVLASAQQQVAEAARQAGQPGGGASSTSMREAAAALREAAAQLTRDRERAAAAASASGLPELMQQLREAAQQQGTMQGQLQSLLATTRAAGRSGTEGLDAQGQAQARALARAQREVARALDEAADVDASGRASELAREARGVAQQLDQGIVTPATEQRLERLLGRMLDAGRALEQEERAQTQRREAQAADRSAAPIIPGATPATGAAASRYAAPTWAELRTLSPEERTVVLEYFRRLNAERMP